MTITVYERPQKALAKPRKAFAKAYAVKLPPPAKAALVEMVESDADPDLIPRIGSFCSFLVNAFETRSAIKTYIAVDGRKDLPSGGLDARFKGWVPQQHLHHMHGSINALGIRGRVLMCLDSAEDLELKRIILVHSTHTRNRKLASDPPEDGKEGKGKEGSAWEASVAAWHALCTGIDKLTPGWKWNKSPHYD